MLKVRRYLEQRMYHVFRLRNNENLIPIDPFSVNYELLRYLDFNAFRPITAFIIHGFTASIESAWMTEMAEAYLSRVR